MTNLRELLEFDPNLKTGEKGYERAQRIVTFMRQSMKPLVEEHRARENKQYLYGMQDQRDIKAMFKDAKKAGIKFWQIAVMEKIRNVLIAEEENQGIQFELKAVDVTASSDRLQDQKLLQNRGWIDATMTAFNNQMGLPPYSMMKEKGLFAGNVDQFDKMGLEQNNLQDINYFFTQHHRLIYEMVGEEPVNYFIEYNELNEIIPLLMNDILSVKAAAMRINVNEVNGAIDQKYLAAENVAAVRGKRRDFKDASAIRYEQSISVTEFIKLIGNEFDYDRDMMELLRAVNMSSGRNYTGIISGDRLYCGTKDDPCDYGFFLSYHVTMGYIEWKEIDASAHKVSKSNNKGQFGLRPTSVWGETNPNSVYEKDVRYYETTYKAYYLSFGSFSQRLYNYGKLSYQMIDGSEDEYSNYSIIAVQEFGKSAVEVAMPWIELIEKAIKKMDYLIIRAKAPGRLLNYESMLDIAGTLYPNTPPHMAIDQVLRLFTESSNELYTLPKVNGQPVGGGSQVNFDIPHGLSKSVMEFKQIYDWAYTNIMNDLGISPMRSVYQPGERDGEGLQQAVNSYSEKATQYMHKMIVNIVKNVGKRTLSYVQDIILFKDVNSVPYKFLEKAIGEGTMAQIKEMGKTQFHRFGIFVHGLNMAADKNEQKAITLQALQKGEIGYEQWLLINSISSPKKAMYVLAYEKLRKERYQAQLLQQKSQAEMQLEMKQHDNKMAQIKLEGDKGNERENIRGYWYAEGQKISADAKLTEANSKIDAQPELIRQKIDAEQKASENSQQPDAVNNEPAAAANMPEAA